MMGRCTKYSSSTTTPNWSACCRTIFSKKAAADLLWRAIENIVRNAIKYGAEGGVVDAGAWPITYSSTDWCILDWHYAVFDQGGLTTFLAWKSAISAWRSNDLARCQLGFG
jgi:hypothetical protein